MARTRIRPPADLPPPDEAPGQAPDASQASPPIEEAPAPKPGRKRALNGAGAPAGPTPPATSAEAVQAKPEALDAAKALAEALDEQPPLPKLPFATYPNPSEQLTGLIDVTIDQGEGVDLVAEFVELEKQLEIKEALTPQVVRANVNKVEANASRAHRLYVLTKAQFETYKIHAETALGAMRDVARHKLEQMKASKEITKQVTERDIDDMAAITYPDEWANISDRLQRGKLTLERLQRFADLWQRRSWSLSSLNQ